MIVDPKTKKPSRVGFKLDKKEIKFALLRNQGRLYKMTEDLNYIPRLQQKYNEVIQKELLSNLNLNNIFEVPKISKVVINIGAGSRSVSDSKKVNDAFTALELISGQKPVKTIAKKAIAGFKLREGMAVGAKVTLRKAQMYEFIDRLINIALPRVRDFDGLSPKSFDGNGNYAFGIKEHLIFPEINYESVTEIWGMDIIINTTAKNDEQALALLQSFNFPIKKK